MLRLVSEFRPGSHPSPRNTSNDRQTKRERRRRRLHEESTSVVLPRSQTPYSHWASQLSGETGERVVRIYDGADAEMVCSKTAHRGVCVCSDALFQVIFEGSSTVFEAFVRIHSAYSYVSCQYSPLVRHVNIIQVNSVCLMPPMIVGHEGV